MTLAEEFQTRNFSIYGQWTGVLCIPLGIALGISAIFHFDLITMFGALLLTSATILIFVEIPLLLRICPTSAKFDAFIRRISTNYHRATLYAVMSVVQWLSMAVAFTSLIAAAVLLLLAAVFYALAGLKHQEFMSSKTLGGQGIAQMIV